MRLRGAQRNSENCNAGLNMTASPEMRDLAEWLLTCEASAGEASEPVESTVLRVYEKLRQSLVEFAGTAAFLSLASRALAMARSEIPSLHTAEVSADGALRGLGQGLGQGLSEFGPQVDLERDEAGEQRAGDEGIVVIARLLGLLLIFLGAPVTLRLLRNAWPDAHFDNRSSKNGRLP
jgi:hypothetical protein